jgi:CRP-like cAMP-binding protein
MSDGIGLWVLDGLLIRRVGVDGRFGAELLGDGDLLRPWQGEDIDSTLAPTTGWRVIECARLAVLDASAAHRLARYPALTGAVAARALNRARSLAIMMAIVHHARTEVRLHMLLWHLADRWGRVRADGVTLPLQLSHAVLADLVAAQRPSVTVALKKLGERKLIRPLVEGWLLCGEPPGELLELQEVAVPQS